MTKPKPKIRWLQIAAGHHRGMCDVYAFVAYRENDKAHARDMVWRAYAQWPGWKTDIGGEERRYSTLAAAKDACEAWLQDKLSLVKGTRKVMRR